MSTAASPVSTSASPARERRIRLWPGIILVALLWIIFPVLFRVEMDNRIFLTLLQWGPLAIIGLFLAWWIFLSRAPWLDRMETLLVCGLGAAAVIPLIHKSVAPQFYPFVYSVYGLPVVLAAWMTWLVVTPFLSWSVRRFGLLIVVVLAWTYPALLRFDGVTSDLRTISVNFRWKATPEEQFLAARKTAVDNNANVAPEVELAAVQAGDWPGFRGAERNGSRPGVRIATDWNDHPPHPIWRHRVGPGWGSFTVIGRSLFTQEQRGPEEAVVCYNADTGAEVWAHTDLARFQESAGGPGPRGTPTFVGGKLYALGATGKLNCLDAQTGKAHWTRDVVADSGAKTQTWGFTASPLVAQGIVTVFAGGPGSKSVQAYKADSGEPAWSVGEGVNSYSSTHLARLKGVEQILMATDSGLTAFEPTTGHILWKHSPAKVDGARANGAPIVQPTILSESEVLYGTADGGTWRLLLKHEGAGSDWTVQETWCSKAIKPYFNDMVVHKGHIYGFSGSSAIFFVCVDLNDGKLKWSARGYGGGQVLLLPDQDMLLVLTEKNDVALVEANPEKHNQLSKVPQMLEGVKSWSHPVVAHGKLYIRNDEEAACYDLAPESAGITKKN
jgi:outer membrane protein assembly factor BamB